MSDMEPDTSPLDLWLSEIATANEAADAVWDPGFDAGRHIVIAKLGPWLKTYQRPLAFAPKFYHQVFPLPIGEWLINRSIALYGDFCSVEASITIRFQASIAYAQANLEALDRINMHIKTSCNGLINDTIDQRLQLLANGDWIDQGLEPVERRIERLINETLTFQGVQCRALCEMQASFAEISENQRLDDRFAHENIYLKVLKKNFEVKELQNQEKQRQEVLLEQKRLDRQHQLMEQNQQIQELARIAQEQEATHRKQQLEEQERQLAEQLNIEQRLHLEKVYHQENLKRAEQESAAETQRKIQEKQLELEEQLLRERLEHQQKLKAIQLSAEIADFEKNQEAWNETHERLKIEKIDQEKRLKQLEMEAELALQDSRQNEEHQLQERLLKEKMLHEARMKDMELAMQIQEHEKRYAATQQLDNYIRRDIELLILEKHRGELIQEVKKVKQDDIRSIPAPSSNNPPIQPDSD
jgi:hypothetical protein